MRVIGWVFVFATILGSSCSVDDACLMENVGETGQATLRIAVSSQPMAKSRVQGSALPEGASIGVFLRNDDGGRYDYLGLHNALYTSQGAGGDRTWMAEEGDLRLTETVGTSYAYFPWKSTVTDNPVIPITNDGTDWMYATPVSGLSYSQPFARFELQHAMAVVRVKVVKGGYTGAGIETTVRIASGTLATKVNMDIVHGTVTDIEGNGEGIVAYNIGTLSEDPLVAELWGIPTGATYAISIWVVVDGNRFSAVTPELTPVAGTVYSFTITLDEINVGSEVNGSE